LVCDLHCYAEKRIDAGWQPLPASFFGNRDYAVFGFLANVRNYAMATPVAAPRGLPDDASSTVRKLYYNLGDDAHTASWLSVTELLEFDYDQAVEDRTESGSATSTPWRGLRTCAPGEGRVTTYRRLLGAAYFEELERLHQDGADRIVFWFDN
jgi:hypothetical protein